ncbi:winged helix-turn-helix domain-containing protein [[Curtobacterium] plantarum]|uniref:winged helix-turn-helix domain-containing protein n=1 Tax=[Curtobacterium] plantarum TaxID=221276 RepID=UPI001FCA0F03|nr:winged helix-turn-helix domain-containing protein [[Curtobacterium] plantarum]
MSRKIILNKVLVFEPEKKRITGKGNPVIISTSAALCMELLIDNVGELVTHQQFFDYVWRRFGMEPTSTSLYQNISNLRRAISKSGIKEDMIRTLPKRGFLLSPQTTVLKQSTTNLYDAEPSGEYARSLSPAGINLIEKDEQLTENQKLPPPKNTLKNQLVFFIIKFRTFNEKVSIKKKFLLIMLPVCFFFVSLAIFYGIDSDDAGFKYSTNYEECEIYNNDDAWLDESEVIKIVENIKVNCNKNSYIYLTAYKNADRISYFSCQNKIVSNKRANCRSYYYVKNFQ